VAGFGGSNSKSHCKVCTDMHAHTICCLLQLPSKLHWHRPARPRRLNNYRTAAIFDPSCASRTLQHICYIAACTAHRVASSDCHNRVSRYAQGSSNQHFDVIATDGTLCCNCVTQICYRHVGRQKKRQTTAHAESIDRGTVTAPHACSRGRIWHAICSE